MARSYTSRVRATSPVDSCTHTQSSAQHSARRQHDPTARSALVHVYRAHRIPTPKARASSLM